MIWLLVQRGPCDWRYIRAEPPCHKGEIRASFRWLNITVGWQAEATKEQGNG